MPNPIHDRWFENRFHRRALKGGEKWFGGFYRGGQFLPFYVPRPRMPQIDEIDYPDFMKFACERGVRVGRGTTRPEKLKPHQRLDPFHAEQMPDSVKAKAVFISAEGFILDGNHRWLLHMRDRSKVPIIIIELPFEEAINLMFDFPKTYALICEKERN